MSIGRLFIANRGEIAVRVAKACAALGVETVLGVSMADRNSKAATMADRVVCIGPAAAKESYLKCEAIVHAAISTGCQAVHPGYGFLSENPRLAELCTENGLRFVGPRPETIRLMGNKLEARAAAKKVGVPLLPGTEAVGSIADAKALAERIGYPALIKAAAGGGGRGMKVALSPDALESAVSLAKAEAGAAFGDATLYMERYVVNARHIEVQVLGDATGKIIHLGERDCTLQRRHQKVIEEAPATGVPNSVREAIRSSALALCRSVGYENAGTVEFLFDEDSGEFFFLEMNTRIQVEHPVTEAVTGIDLVSEQIRIAGGQPLALSQDQIHIDGHAIEARITAECAERRFRPSPGKIELWQQPDGPGVRVDTHSYSGYVVPPFYDSLLAKLVVKGRDRAEAIERMRGALDEFEVKGIETTIPFIRMVLDDPSFANWTVNTRWLEELVDRRYSQ